MRVRRGFAFEVQIAAHTHAMRIVQGFAAATAGLLLAGFSGSGGDAGNAQSCEAQEAEEYPALEAVAEDALTGAAFVLERRSSCEETGSPGPSVIATVENMGTKEVRGLLHDGDWTPDESGALRSPDGDLGAYVRARSSIRVEVAFRGPVGYWNS